MSDYRDLAKKLCGLVQDGEDWVGTNEQWSNFERFEKFYEQYGRFPQDDGVYKEKEPGIWIK